MLETLQLVNVQNIDLILGSLPLEVLEALRSFVDAYHSGVRVFNGPRPSEESVRTVKVWLAKRALLKSNP
jgi:hypothetical protein